MMNEFNSVAEAAAFLRTAPDNAECVTQSESRNVEHVRHSFNDHGLRVTIEPMDAPKWKIRKVQFEPELEAVRRATQKKYAGGGPVVGDFRGLKIGESVQLQGSQKILSRRLVAEYGPWTTSLRKVPGTDSTWIATRLHETPQPPKNGVNKLTQ